MSHYDTIQSIHFTLRVIKIDIKNPTSCIFSSNIPNKNGDTE